MALLLKQPGYLLLKMGGKILLKGDAGAVLHLVAPAWRTVDTGNGQTTAITFASALDPQELKYYTINWATELDGTTDTIALSEFSLSASAIGLSRRQRRMRGNRTAIPDLCRFDTLTASKPSSNT